MTFGASSSTYGDSGSGIDMNIIYFFDVLSESYMGILSEVFEELLEEQEQGLREKAQGSDKWQSLSDKIEVSYNGKYVDYQVVGNPDDHASFTKTEYGDFFEAPRPLFRVFASRNTNDMAEKFNRKMRLALGESSA